MTDQTLHCREALKRAIYEDLCAADNNDVPLEDYPERILRVITANTCAQEAGVVSDHCQIAGCVHKAHGSPAWPAATDPFSFPTLPDVDEAAPFAYAYVGKPVGEDGWRKIDFVRAAGRWGGALKRLAKLREVEEVPLYTRSNAQGGSTVPSVPDGWLIEEADGGFIHVESPQALAVNLGFFPDGNRTASELLRQLAAALIAQRGEAGNG